MPHRPAKSRPICLIAAIVSFVLTGCAQPLAPQANPAPVAAEDYRRTFEAAVASLKHHGFLIDRQDYRFGRITTKPRIAPQIFEVWKADNSSLDQAGASSLSDRQRIATVQLAPASGAGDATSPPAAYQLTVAVAIEQATDPNRRLAGSTSGYVVVDYLATTPEQFKRDGITGKSFVPAGNDSQFEQRILADIQARLAGGGKEEEEGKRDEGQGAESEGTVIEPR